MLTDDMIIGMVIGKISSQYNTLFWLHNGRSDTWI